jgi:peptidoglycan/LPS O-acetylase OafA/YrhL
MLAYLLLKPPLWHFVIGGNRIWPENLLFSLSAAITIVWVVEGCPGFRPAFWALSSPPLAYLGRISYALYLWHELVGVSVRWANLGGVRAEPWTPPIAIVLSVAVASFSYWFVERPFLRMKWRLSTTGSHDVDASVVLHGTASELQPLPAES